MKTETETITTREVIWLAGNLIACALVGIGIALPIAYLVYPLFMPIYNYFI